MSKAEEILEKLKRSFNTPSKKDERLKVVLICVFISTTFWFFNALNKSDYVTRINYPISIEFDEDNYVATAPLPTKIPVEVTGGGWDLMARYFGLKMNALEVRVERPSESSYVLASSIRPEIAPNLEPIVINYFLQDSIKFQIERKVTREVVLAYDTAQISLDEDLVMASKVELSPPTVELTGPESMLNELGDTLFIQEEISDVSEDFQGSVNLPELPELVSTSLSSVEASFLVVQLLSIDVSIPLEKRNFPNNWELLPTRAQVYYKVPETSFDVADTTGVRVFANFRQMEADSTIAIEFKVLNKEFREVRVFPKTVKVKKNE